MGFFEKKEKELNAATKQLILSQRISNTSEVILEMVDCLRKHGANPELLDYAENNLVRGLLAADCSLNWIKPTPNSKENE